MLVFAFFVLVIFLSCAFWYFYEIYDAYDVYGACDVCAF
jgi:hypothetical protein